ncbi:MAG: hypothetical protein ABJC09_15415 [Terriglobia bacterium]
MRSTFGAVAILSFLGFGADNINFDSTKPGTTPRGWSFAETHSGSRAKWEVRNDPSAPSRGNVLDQKSGSPGPYDFPLAIFDGTTCVDGDLSVKLKIDANRSSRTAGLIWRYQDPGNYYLLHFSAEEKNVAIFRMVNGKAQPVQVAGAKPGVSVPHDVHPAQWYVVKVIFRGPMFRVFVGNRKLFEARDEGLTLPGKTGVWTKGRTTASFDDFRIDKKN